MANNINYMTKIYVILTNKLNGYRNEGDLILLNYDINLMHREYEVTSRFLVKPSKKVESFKGVHANRKCTFVFNHL